MTKTSHTLFAVLPAAAVAAFSLLAPPAWCGPPADAAEAIPAASASSVPMGVNLEGLADWMRTPLFVNAIKTSRPFGSPDKPWEDTVKTDAHGNPTEDAGTCAITDLPHMGGTYHFSCTGKADVGTVASSAQIANQRYSSSTNRTTADVVVAPDADKLILNFTHTAGGIQDIRLLRPGYPAGTKQIFTDEFLRAIKPFSVLRLMDYTQTNNSAAMRWNDRPTPADVQYTLGKGGALEDMIALANAAGKDLWINIPDQADDDYVRQEAKLFKATLQPGRKVYLEYSNEVWNFAFQQTGRNQRAAETEAQVPRSLLRVDTGVPYDDPKNKWYWGFKRVAARLVYVAGIWKDVYGADFKTVVRPVLASQIANPTVLSLQLGYIAKNVGPPADILYAVAGAPYYALSDDAAKKPDLTKDQVLAELGTSLDTDIVKWERDFAGLASQYNVKLLAYEGGPDIRQAEQSVDAKLAANRDPRMKDLTVHFLHGWYQSSGDLMVYFNLCGGYSKWGAWGLTDDMTDLQTPKYQGVLQVMASPRPAPQKAAPR